jgi:2',3'-cyclic-nucleotide 2'-phosphodiesterase (5'-nucleotidase family)
LYSIGKREFSYDVDVLSLRAQGAQFPIISSNTLDNRTNEVIEGLFKSYQFDVDGMKISIASIIDPRTLITYAPKYVKMISMDKALQQIESEQKDADVKVLMTDLNSENTIKIAKQYNFDLILVAQDKVDETFKVGDTTVAIGGGQDGDVVVVELDKNETLNVSAKIQSLSDHRADPEIAAFVDKYRLRLGGLYNEHIATARVNFNTNRELVRTQENALANIFTDALRHFSHAQIAVINSGSIRNSSQYPMGYRFTRFDIQSEFPFGGYLVVIDIKGAEIWDMMENSVSRIEHVDGRFFHVSGMSVLYDSKAAQGSRIKSIKVGEQPLNREATYTMAMQDFFLKGADEYYMLEKKIPTNNLYSKYRIWNIVAQYLSNKKDIIYPIMQRLVNLSANEN